MTQQLFSREELQRYSRHIIIPEFNLEGQRKLKQAKVLVIGSGGLGSPLLLYLAAAGVGTIGIVDFDVVDDSNLQRQVLFSVEDVGTPKVDAARRKLESLNPHIQINTHSERLSSDNALEIFRGYDVVADGTDNFPTRYLVNDACCLLGIPNVYASIYRFEGQVSVFNYADASGNRGPNYRDLFPEPPPPGLVPSCAEGGVIGVLPGIIGSMQANEVIKVVTGIGEPLSGRLFLFDAFHFTTRILNIHAGQGYKIEKLIDYEQFCGFGQAASAESEAVGQEIVVQEFHNWREQGQAFQLVDVREPFEYEIANLGGVLIPLGSIREHTHRIRKDIPVVVHCKGGKRSADAIQILQQEFGFDNLYNLKGGILGYAREVDPTLATY